MSFDRDETNYVFEKESYRVFKCARFSRGDMNKMSETGVVLLNLANTQRSPKSETPAFRILGSFKTREEAKRHSALNPTPDATVVCSDLRKWFPIMSTENATEDEAQARLTKLMEDYTTREKYHAEEFATNVSQQKMGTSNASKVQMRKDTSAITDRTGDVERVQRNSEVRQQNYALISYVPDLSERDVKEPALIVWDVYDSEESASHAAKEDYGKRYFDVHLDVVALYEFLHPTLLDPNQITEQYREKELDEIMAVKKAEKKKVQDFERWCEQTNQDVPEIIIPSSTDYDGSAPTLPQPIDISAASSTDGVSSSDPSLTDLAGSSS